MGNFLEKHQCKYQRTSTKKKNEHQIEKKEENKIQEEKQIEQEKKKIKEDMREIKQKREELNEIMHLLKEECDNIERRFNQAVSDKNYMLAGELQPKLKIKKQNLQAKLSEWEAIKKDDKTNCTLTKLLVYTNKIRDARETMIGDAFKFKRYSGTVEYNTKRGWKTGQILSFNTDGTYQIRQSNGIIGHNWKTKNLRNKDIIKDLPTQFKERIVNYSRQSLSDDQVSIIADNLCANSTTTQLDLSKNQITDVGATAIGEALKKNSSIKKLNIGGNQITDGGIYAIGKALETNNIIEQIILNSKIYVKSFRNETMINASFRGYLNEDAIIISCLLKVNSAITVIALSGNQIADRGVMAIVEVLKMNATIIDLDLSENQIADPGATAIGQALKTNCTLTKLLVYTNKIGDAGATVIGNAFKINSSLRYLDLALNKIEDKGATAIAEGLKTNKTLKTFYIHLNNITKNGKSCLNKITKNQVSITTFQM